MNWSISGTLPPGIKIDVGTGIISGTPSSPGSFSFIVSVDDGQGNTSSKSYTVIVAPAGTGVPLVITPDILPHGIVGQAYGPVQFVATTQGPQTTRIFPSDHILNTPIDKAPLLANSDAMIAQIKADAAGRETVHPGFEIPISEGTFTAKNILISSVLPSGESDAGPYQIPDNPAIEAGGDGHVLSVSNGKLYELFGFSLGPPASAGSGAIWDLSSYVLRRNGDTSADGAGLPIYPLMIRFKEFVTGEIKHALRVTVVKSRSFGSYAGMEGAGNPPVADWPARHRSNHAIVDPNVPAMGQRLRLKATFDDSGLSPETQIITKCLKKYGAIVADAGSTMFFQGDTDPGWLGPTSGAFSSLTDKLVTELRNVHITDFEAIDGVSPFIIDVDSGKSKQL